MSNSNAPSKTDAVVKLFVVLLVCLFSFAVGTYVGKKFSDEQAKLAKFEGANPVSSPVLTSAKTENLQTLSDEEVLALAREFMNEETPSRTVASAEANKPADSGNSANAGSGSSKDEMQVTTKPAAAKTTPVKLAEEIAREAAGKFTVQIASYPQEILAERRVELLRKDGFNAFYYPTSLLDKTTKETRTWYRVAIGIFDDQTAAEAYRKDLLSRAKIESAFIQRLPRAE
jgi:cell division septation protein DedD